MAAFGCRLSSAVFLCSLFGAYSVSAQVDPSEASEPPLVGAGGGSGEAVTPPKLISEPRAPAPPKPLDAPRAVVVELVVNERGKVEDAVVIESDDAELDALALQAVREFDFEPATASGKPVSVKIRYRYVFEPTPVPSEDVESELPAESTATAPVEQPDPPRPTEAAQIETFEATAEVRSPPREVTRRTVKGDEMRRLPGTRGDALRAIEVMPGVARTPLSQGSLILRGAAWNESQAFLNGTPVPFLYHFGGLTSFFPTRFVEEINLYPGNFSSRYGRLAGGIVEVQSRDPLTDRIHAGFDLNVIDSSAFVEAPLGSATGVAGAVRRSNIDFFFENFVPEDAYSVVAAPLYWDWQALGTHRISEHTRLRLFGYGSRDSIELLFSEPLDEDPGLAGSVRGSLEFHRVGFALERRRATEQQSLSATLGIIDLAQRLGPFQQDLYGPELYVRGEASTEISEQLRVTGGVDVAGALYEGTYRGPLPGQTEGSPRQNDPIGSRRLVSVSDDAIDILRPAAYVELGIRPLPELLLIPGLRVDYFAELEIVTVDPRFSARHEIESTTLKGGIGLFTQAPEFWQSLDAVGNPDIDPYRAWQASAGLEQRFGEQAEVGVEGFYKHLVDVIVATPDDRPPRYVNEGEGRIYGAELFTKLRPSQKGLVYLAYTLSRSERRDRAGGYRRFDQDQTHLLSLVASQGFGAGWEVGARFRLVSGNPITPIVGSSYDATNGVYVPTYGQTNSARNPTFHQLDVRVEKAFVVGTGVIAVYLDLLNAYNARNQEGFRYSYDYRKREAVAGLPILPNLGIRGEL